MTNVFSTKLTKFIKWMVHPRRMKILWSP